MPRYPVHTRATGQYSAARLSPQKIATLPYPWDRPEAMVRIYWRSRCGAPAKGTLIGLAARLALPYGSRAGAPRQSPDPTVSPRVPAPTLLFSTCHPDPSVRPTIRHKALPRVSSVKLLGTILATPTELLVTVSLQLSPQLPEYPIPAHGRRAVGSGTKGGAFLI